MSDSIEKVKILLAGLLEKMGIEANIEVREQPGTVVFNIRTADTNMLIGKHGVNLYALQYICRIIARRKIADELNFLVDVDDYKRKRETFLENLADEAKSLALTNNKAVVLKSMPSYERRLVHAKLNGDTDVTTDSIGEEPERMVVVKPIGLETFPQPQELHFKENEDYILVG